VSNEKKHTIEMTAALDALIGTAYVDYLRVVSPSASAGDLVTVQDIDGDPVARFVATGANFTDLCWINAKIQGLNVPVNTGGRAVLEMHIRI
jgi:hypothetical protein